MSGEVVAEHQPTPVVEWERSGGKPRAARPVWEQPGEWAGYSRYWATAPQYRGVGYIDAGRHTAVRVNWW